MKKTKTKAYNIFSVVLSVVLCVALAVTLLCATAIKEEREYLTSSKFEGQIQSMKPGEIKFISNGEKVTLQDYLTKYVRDYLEKVLPNLAPFSGYAVDAVLSSNLVSNEMRDQLFDAVDYILFSDSQEAKERVEQGITIEENEDFNVRNADNIEELVDTTIQLVVLGYVEDMTGVTIDEIIIILSEDTLSTLNIISIILVILLVLLNIKGLENIFMYLTASLSVYSVGIKLIENEFISATAGKEDLANYIFVKPFIESFSENLTGALILALVLILIFVAVVLVGNKFKKAK